MKNSIKQRKEQNALFTNADSTALLCAIRSALQLDMFDKHEGATLAEAVSRKDAVLYDIYNQSGNLYKKLEPREIFYGDSKETKNEIRKERQVLSSAAVEKFAATYHRLLNTDLSFLDSLDRNVPGLNRSGRIFQRARSIVHAIIPDNLSINELFTRCKHGTGVSLGTKFGLTTDTCKWTAKKLTVTKDCIPLFRLYLLWDSDFFEHLCEVRGYPLNRNLSLIQAIDLFLQDNLEQVGSSRACTVRKNDTTDRLIAIEPIVNMFFQQGYMALLYELLCQIGVDLTKQDDKNGFLAYIGSVAPELWCTLDMESASDSVLLKLIQFLWPIDHFDLLSRLRCDKMVFSTEYSNIFDVESVLLPMISTMGNATTFPIETIVFYSLMIAVISINDDTNKNTTLVDISKYKDRVGIYGDDCIIPQKYVPELIGILNLVGFQVNMEKSFFGSECFRESCGQDFFNGRNVRAVYIRSRPPQKLSSLEAWHYKYFNLLLQKCISHFGELSYIYQCQTLMEVFFSSFRRLNIRPCIVPPDYPVDSGIHLVDTRLLSLPTFLSTNPHMPILSPQKGGIVFRFIRFKYKYEHEAYDYFKYRQFLREAAISTTRDDPFHKKGYTLRQAALIHMNQKRKFEAAAKECKHLENRKGVGGYVQAKGLSFTLC